MLELLTMMKAMQNSLESQSVENYENNKSNPNFSEGEIHRIPNSWIVLSILMSATVGVFSTALAEQFETGMLVKSVDLPKFTIQTETVNQYNRKKAIQTTHEPGEITITFQDDNMGLINKLWQNYYSYYYSDSSSAKSSNAYSRNATKNFNFVSKPYGLDNGSTSPFFNYITIYQMARHEFISYKLINPIVSSWDHSKLDYSDTKTNEFTMKIRYEAVTYNSGFVEHGDVEGFGYEHYDTVPSPLVGLADTQSHSPSFAKSENTSNNSLLNTIIEQINTAQNSKELTNAGTKGVINNLAQDSPDSVSGLSGYSFPKSSTTKK
mgnify:CR=1 FL=1